MRILYVAANYLPEMGAGPGRVSEMARVWVEAGHEVEVLAPVPNHPNGVIPPEYRNGLLFRERDACGVEATRTWVWAAPNRGRVRRSLAFGSFAAASVIAGTLATRRPDVIIGSSPQLLAAFSAGVIARARRIPWVFEVRDLWPESVVAVGALSGQHPVVQSLSRIADAMYRNANHIVVVTEAARKFVVNRGIADGQISLIPNGVDTTRFTPQPPLEADRRLMGGNARFIVSYIGTIGMAQNLDCLLEAASRMRARSDIAFAFVGDGAERASLEQRARNRHLVNVRFLGMQPRVRIPALYAASDLCVVPLRNCELFTGTVPSKIFELLAMGRPIVLAVDGEARSIVERSGAGRFAQPGSAEAMQFAIEHLLEDPIRLREIAARGPVFVSTRYNRTEFAIRYLNLLKKVVARSHPQGRREED